MQKQNELTINSVVSQQPGHMVSDMNGEKVMLSIQNGKYYNLGSIGGEIWTLMSSPITVSGMVDELTIRYEVERAQCEKEVLHFINELLKENLIQHE
ncbi:lasso peptide biosynthesis PqqD family chaperone [Jeotgalibacillus aurantiacus]|uniref:lasso peptide biosynthesis PqqD family chaperone n=1 Tax=Jeotgalibacillus aurantiacus TaxID=2763266 RepID=UPI001D0B15D3|nr:lasso peptide biosynthesis PqqD family chaperone [Jeotgalibacillus aurantiacus]